MNSILQQFFMIPAFRYNLLALDTSDRKKNIQRYKGLVIEDNLLLQMQRLFANLEISENNEYDPTGFCYSYKEHDGSKEPTNTGMQKDSQEFLNFFLNRLNDELKGTTREHLVQDTF